MQAPGDSARERFWQLLEPHWSALGGLARQLVPPGEEGDLLQDGLLLGLRGLAGLKDEASFRPWMARILVHEARRRHRRQKLRGWLRLGGSWADGPGARGVPEPVAEGADGEALLRRWHLKCALAALPAPHREVLLLHYLAGLPLAEVAQVRGESLSAVKTRLSRARRELRGLLAGRLDLSLIGRQSEEDLDHGFERELDGRLRGQES